jgi:hypothetical protein
MRRRRQAQPVARALPTYHLGQVLPRQTCLCGESNLRRVVAVIDAGHVETRCVYCKLVFVTPGTLVAPPARRDTCPSPSCETCPTFSSCGDANERGAA